MARKVDRLPVTVPEVFRGAIVALEELAATVNAWAADGFTAELDWYELEPLEAEGYGERPTERVYVCAWLAADEPEP